MRDFAAANTGAREALASLDGRNFAVYPQIRKAIGRFAPKALEKLYRLIAAHPHASRLLPSDDQRDRAASAQLNHWNALFSSNFGPDSIERAQCIGAVHAHIGLTPGLYISGYAMVLEELIESMLGGFSIWPGSRKQRARAVATLVKTALYDMEAALGTYFDAETAQRNLVLDSMREALGKVAAGDLQSQLQDLPPAYEQLARDFHSMRYNISTMMVQMTEAADNVQTGAQEISSAASDLANRTETQAATVARIAEVMKDVTGGIGTTATTAKEVDEAVSEVSGFAARGGEIMDETVVAMEKIQTSSTEIAMIIDVIDSIAFQTNLLALNAGVEAARAGDAGKGFAVVASEVRALAHRTTESAKTIKDLVTHSNGNVDQGAQLVEQMRSALQQIIDRLGHTIQKSQQIATYSQNQSVNMQSLSQQLEQIDLNTQQNAAMVEESNAAARGLSEQAAGMARIVSRFKFERRLKLRKDKKPGEEGIDDGSDWEGTGAGGAANARHAA